MQTACPNCEAAIETPYIMLGAATSCPGCGALVRSAPKPGTSYPPTGYAISFSDFIQLLTHQVYRPHAIALVKNWFPQIDQLSVANSPVAAGSKEERVLLQVHLRIQTEPKWQYDLYQMAMSLWR